MKLVTITQKWIILSICLAFFSSFSFGFFDFIVDSPYQNRVKVYFPTANLLVDSGGNYTWYDIPTKKVILPKLTDFGLSTKYIQTDSGQAGFFPANSQNMILLGGHLNWHINPHIHMGWKAYGGVIANQKEQFKMGYTGLALQWLCPSPFREIQLSAGCLIGFGVMERQTSSLQQQGFWIAEPGMGMQINFSECIQLRLETSCLLTETVYSTRAERIQTPPLLSGTLSLFINLL